MGALVSGVEQDAPADKAGILPGDVIISFNGKPINKFSDLPRLVGEVKPGTSAPIEVWRKGKPVKLKVTVGEMKVDAKVVAKAETAKPAEAATTVLGMGVVPVEAEVQTKLRIKGGVQVTSVEAPASSAGIAEGDIILTANDTDITGPEQFTKIVAGLDKTRPVGLMVRRGDQTQWVAVKPTK
jgi:serine protease Do